jgi:YD repeat-containing protein
LNRIATAIDPLGGQTSVVYDPNGRILAVTDPRNHATTFAYDADDHLATRTDPLQKVDHYFYDRNGNTARTVDRRGHVTTYAYDARDRVRLITYSDGLTTE